jgi:C2H2 transcription facotor
MAAAFKPVNNPMTPEAKKDDHTMATPTTPRPSLSSQPSVASPPMEDATTPTKASFASSALATQKPLPTSPFPEAVQIPEPSDTKVPQRENSQISRKSRDSDEMDMDESDEEGAGDDGGSDDESVNADGTRSGKKKKSQRFYCTDYPPCNLSFTRSEHLARHIRYV